MLATLAARAGRLRQPPLWRRLTSSSAALAASNGGAAASSLSVRELPTNESSDRLLRTRHTAAHVMAMAVQTMYPTIQVTLGPWIDNGWVWRRRWWMVGDGSCALSCGVMLGTHRSREKGTPLLIVPSDHAATSSYSHHPLVSIAPSL